MKRLLAIICRPQYMLLVVFTAIGSLFCTLAGQLEMFALGVITKTGPNVAGDVVSEGIAWVERIFPLTKSVWYLVGGLLSVALFKAVSLFGYRFGARLLAVYVSRDVRQRYFEHLQGLPMGFYQENQVGAISSRVMTDATMVADGLNSAIVNYLQTPMAFVTTLAACFVVSWKLSLLVFVGLPLLVLPIVWLAQRMKRLARQLQKRQEAFASVLLEFLSGIQTIKLFAMEAVLQRKYQGHNDQMANVERRSARYDVASRPILHTVGILCLVVVLLFGMYGLELPLHELLFYCGLLACVYEPIKKYAEENGRIQRGIAACERMEEIFTVPLQEGDEGTEALLQGNLEFEGVSFRYAEEWALRGVSFRASKGSTVAIVGPTGAGKSTIALLLPRLYDAHEGEIRLDGVPLSTYSRRSLRQQMAFVPQKPFLFCDTVAENIAFGQPYSREDVRAAAIQAHADEFICQLPQGYDTVLAEGGSNLSGGQQQRLAIARALIKKVPLLIMDEATSALDAISESHIKQALLELRGKVTQLIIAHRLSTIEDADSIIYLDRGTKIAEGTKEELLESCPPFRAMWELLRR